MAIASRIRGFLIDLDGTVVEANRLIPGVPGTLAWLREKGLPYRFVTNTTSKPRQAIIEKLHGVGLDITPEELFSAPIVGRDFLLSQGLTRCFPLIKASLQVDLEGSSWWKRNPRPCWWATSVTS